MKKFRLRQEDKSMPAILSVSTEIPPYTIAQEETEAIVRELFRESFTDIDRMMKIFGNSQIERRNFVVPKEWFEKDHSFEEKNDLYIKEAVRLGCGAIRTCLAPSEFLTEAVPFEDIDAIILVSSSGFSTPTIDAKIMNELPFSPHTKRIPIWGLGCAGGAVGMSRAYEYCRAYPDAKVLVVCIELCSITFQRNDTRKSNLVGTSLFADGVACALVTGDEAVNTGKPKLPALPTIHGTQSTLMPDSEDVMGWDIKNSGLHVIFSRDIPSIIRDWLRPNVETFLAQQELKHEDIHYFVAHPGGRKVLEAYETALNYSEQMTEIPRQVLTNNGNMSSPTVLYVLKDIMLQQPSAGSQGIMTALGPGFSSELLHLIWEGSPCSSGH
ncbi:type III polyketide synthase [Alteribacter keqinensis]|uniref:Type III polyketide synthase n=1 Tax=Alteribacter keqinensis TaxID=2483800 RepID=A0A3M7TQT4_9BACI|nr:3-oxoacyl-[acyl-carrier-protein] synthase III C-terminal domain-containing protein [Alteribacter keqinensis]RNA66710.1 type III polyketide synthase [Alteribacter keqinensis]